MTKKIFTLLAAVTFLLGMSVSVFASVPHTPFDPAAATGISAKGLVTGANSGLYHIAQVNPTSGDVEGLLYVDNTNTASAGTVTIDLSPANRSLGEALWCVEISTEAQGKNPSFTFLNKAYGDNLRADETPVNSLVLDGPLTDWKFSNIYGSTVVLEEKQPIYSYINGSQAIVLVKGTAAGAVKTVIADVVAIEAAAAAGNATLGAETLLYFTLKEAAPIVLTAKDFNTKLGTEPTATGQKLTFSPDKNTGDNPFSGNVLTAENAAISTTGADLYLNLKNADGKYLRVDTSIVNSIGSYFLKFKFTDAIDVKLARQYAFRFVYFPSNDSLIINVKDAIQPSKSLDAAGKIAFSDVATVTTVHGAREGLLISEDDIYDNATTELKDFTYIILQDLNNNKIVTVGELPSQTHISLGLGGCEVAVSKTSLAGLYTIKNKAGKYLQIPIYTDTAAIAPQWVTVEQYVDVNEMPSFQWVIEKIRTSDPGNTSQIKITNREYGISVGTIQLWSDKDNDLYGAALASGIDAFKEVDEAYRENQYLGYKYVAKDVAEVSTYTFNYLHELDDTQYLSVKNSTSDNLLYIQKDADAFELVPCYTSPGMGGGYGLIPEEYGYQPAAWTKSGYAVQLKRTPYVLKTKDGSKIYNTGKVVVVDKEDRYAVVEPSTITTKGDSAVFYMKTNNTKGGKNYYALVDLASKTPDNNTKWYTIKAGVSDHDMGVKAQNHYEIRTSAFAVEQNESPLYRRFNRTTDGAIGSESFYNGPAGSDNPDTLRFFRMNNVKEFLYEDKNSENYSVKGINFLGVKHEADFTVTGDKLASGTALYVDTAYVARPYIAGLTEDTPKPQYLIGVGVTKVEGSTIEIPCEPSVETPFYKRGRYLINATDSAKVNDKYIWDTKWERLAFVDAVHLYDTLYVLNGQTYADPIDFTALKADSKVKAIRLDNNYHKDVVFSFRLFKEEKGVAYADQDQNFLIESETKDRGTTPVIAPRNGGWVKIQNGVPVISRGAYADAITEAERFNVVKTNADPVANEDINVVDFKVVAGEGAITILNAAGKNVVVSNILGQVVANTVLTSDNATIATPKGIVVVAVAGESAVKAIVK